MLDVLELGGEGGEGEGKGEGKGEGRLEGEEGGEGEGEGEGGKLWRGENDEWKAVSIYFGKCIERWLHNFCTMYCGQDMRELQYITVL